jgi:hypothetical protein
MGLPPTFHGYRTPDGSSNSPIVYSKNTAVNVNLGCCPYFAKVMASAGVKEPTPPLPVTKWGGPSAFIAIAQ